MADAYAINTQKVEIQPSAGKHFSDPEFIGNFSISSKLDQLGIKKGAKAIVFQPELEDLKFVSVGEIRTVFETTDIKPSQEQIRRAEAIGSPPPRDIYRHNFQIQIDQKLLKNNLLSELEYSLKDVYRYNNPKIHFHTQYREIKEDDFETIINGLIYTARTAFGKLVNAIPRQNKLEFLIHVMNKYSTIDFAKIPLQTGLEVLYDYIERRILNKGLLLVETDRILKEKFNEILDPQQIGFTDPESNNYDLIGPQASYFNKLLRLDREYDFKNYIKNTISKNLELESRFNKIFEKETWPIDLRL